MFPTSFQSSGARGIRNVAFILACALLLVEIHVTEAALVVSMRLVGDQLTASAVVIEGLGPPERPPAVRTLTVDDQVVAGVPFAVLASSASLSEWTARRRLIARTERGRRGIRCRWIRVCGRQREIVHQLTLHRWVQNEWRCVAYVCFLCG